jgi:predicted amidophosphoribosyltransferase
VAETATAIRWVKTVERLVHMGAEARREAMANAFEASNVTGRKVVILDDVRTTGSTLRAAAKAVKTAGGDPTVVALTQTLSTSHVP